MLLEWDLGMGNSKNVEGFYSCEACDQQMERHFSELINFLAKPYIVLWHLKHWKYID